MDKRSKELGAILLTNLVLNTEVLSRGNRKSVDVLDSYNALDNLSANKLYSRLLAGAKFAGMGNSQKRDFLLAPQSVEDGKLDTLYSKRMKEFVMQAHKRSCDSLGVGETKIVYCDFKANPALDEDFFSVYDFNNGNIFINNNISYEKQTPSYFLEELNTRTRSHSISRNIFKAIQSPDSLGDKEYFLALMTALKCYLYQYVKTSFDKETTNSVTLLDYATPEKVESVLYGFKGAREDLQKAGLYGGEIRDKLREGEGDFYELLQKSLLEECLRNHEDMIDNFKGSPLNEQSGNLLFTILKGLEMNLASNYYNSLGAKMEKGQDVTSYLDKLQKEKLKSFGIDATDEELDEIARMNYDIEENGEFDDVMAEDDEYQNSHDDIMDVEEELREIDDELSEIEEIEEYNEFDNVLPKEGKINEVKDIPFRKFKQQEAERNME